METSVDLEECKFTFTQEGNTTDDEEFEQIDIEYKSSLGLDRDKDGFFVIKTTQWSLDSVADLDRLFQRIKKVMK